MKLSIVTINFNNAEGLRKTLASVASQTYRDIEHIIVDGGSTDGSVDVIKEYESTIKQSVTIDKSTIQVKWISEADNGIYNGMNKGIEIVLGRRIVNPDHTSSYIGAPTETNVCVSHGESGSTSHPSIKRSGVDHCDLVAEHDGDYIQILNSGDILAADDVTERMMIKLDSLNAKRLSLNEDVIDILYGNMIKKDYVTEKVIGKSAEVEYSLRNYYTGTINHDCCYIRRDLFDIYGLYDENLKIVSDWKWFLQAIGLGKVTPVYVDIDVTIFDASGVSETNLGLRNKERRKILEELFPPAILADYDTHAFEMEQMGRLRRHHLYMLVYYIERVLFKLEKWKIIK